MNERACGALLGLAVGDALGTTNEFKTMRAPAFPQLASGPLTEIVGGGPFGVTPVQVTDDTQMACCLYASLKAVGHFDAADVAKRYVAWAKKAFDIGNQTAATLRLVSSGIPARDSGREYWLHSGKRAAANGSLMRTAPIAAVLADSIDDVRNAALADSAITHFDPRCRLGCAAYDVAIAVAISGASANGIWDAAVAEVSYAADAVMTDYDTVELANAVAAIEEDLRLAASDDPQLYGGAVDLQKHQGFVRVAFRLAFWELLHAPTFEAAVRDAANRGGDADTNAAVVGGLFGSVAGIDGIPHDWRTLVLRCEPEGDPVWRDAYHPRIFGCGPDG
jgi:ADP-ribosyl-[dinitrogen reductase] hydrolase